MHGRLSQPMAYSIRIMSSSDSDFEVGENSCFGYQYNPEYTEEELAAASATNEESTNNEELRR